MGCSGLIDSGMSRRRINQYGLRSHRAQTPAPYIECAFCMSTRCIRAHRHHHKDGNNFSHDLLIRMLRRCETNKSPFILILTQFERTVSSNGFTSLNFSISGNGADLLLDINCVSNKVNAVTSFCRMIYVRPRVPQWQTPVEIHRVERDEWACNMDRVKWFRLIASATRIEADSLCVRSNFAFDGKLKFRWLIDSSNLHVNGCHRRCK